MASSSEQIIKSLTSHWEDIKQQIRKDCGLTDISYTTWIEPLTFHEYKDRTVYIVIPTDIEVQQKYLETNYINFFRVAVSEQAGINVNIVFLLQKDVAGATGNKEKPVPAQELRAKDPSDDMTSLNDKYRFDNFVVGGNNNFAYSAAVAVAESPGAVYNPLFLYGGPGLGKTHLMHSIGHFIATTNQQKKILYVTSEQFTNEVIESIRSGDSKIMARFREKYRTVDVLLLDDVQFIIGKESTQEEFFHTFNVLHQAGKQIVLSSDKRPQQMETLDERFRSRFEMGLQADIQAPDYETKVAILKKLGEMYPVAVDDAAYGYIATNIKSNIRELEGAFNKIIAYSRIHNLSLVSEEIATEALKDLLHPDINRVITIKRVIDTVCEHYKISKTEISSKKRTTEIVMPRQIAMYLARKYVLNTSYDDIGQALGGRDHTTVINGYNKITELLKTDAELVRTVDILTKKLNPLL